MALLTDTTHQITGCRTSCGGGLHPLSVRRSENAGKICFEFADDLVLELDVDDLYFVWQEFTERGNPLPGGTP